MHSLIQVDGKTDYLTNIFHHYAIQYLSPHLKKIDKYTNVEANYEFFDRKIKINNFNFIWYLLIKPLMFFLRFFLSLRYYKNGIAGIIYAINGSYYCFLKYAKLWELQKNDNIGERNG